MQTKGELIYRILNRSNTKGFDFCAVKKIMDYKISKKLCDLFKHKINETCR
jgi:hypothetical protein